MTTQQYFQEQVEAIASAAGFRLLTDYEASNCGVWRFYTPDDCAFMFEARFDFQRETINLLWIGIHGRWAKRDLDQALGHLYDFVNAEA